jgi:hypothetical protein
MNKPVLLSLVLCAGCATAEDVANVYQRQRPPTAEERARVLADIRVVLFDPYSVRDAAISNMLFPKEVMAASPNAKAICLRLNARNRFGAYVGLEHQMLKYSAAGALLAIDDTEIAKAQCADTRLGYSPFTELENL